MKKLFLIICFISAIGISCDKQESKDQDANLKETELEKTKERCFEMIYPITFIMEDGTEISGNSRKEIGRAIKAWMAEHPEVQTRPQMKYPVEIKFKGELKVINNDDEMTRVKKACAKEKKACFEFIFPITYIMPDQSEITIEGKDDMENKRAIRAWYVDNPGVEEKPQLQYPVDVIFKERPLTLSNQDDMIKLKRNCK